MTFTLDGDGGARVGELIDGRVRELAAPSMIAWLNGDGRSSTGVEHGADEQIAGFTILNDWSARDVQVREATVGLGVHKSKDFATSLGPWLVTPDELPYEDGTLRVAARVEINGEVGTETSSKLPRFSFKEMRAAAARNTRLRTGDVLPVARSTARASPSSARSAGSIPATPWR